MLQTLHVARRRFVTNFRNPVLRHNVAVLMAGKLLGIGIILGLMWTLMPNFAHAQGSGPGDATAQINAVNTVNGNSAVPGWSILAVLWFVPYRPKIKLG